MLGHSKPETTMIYTHVQKKDLMEIQNPLYVALQKFNKKIKTNKKLYYPEYITVNTSYFLDINSCKILKKGTNENFKSH